MTEQELTEARDRWARKYYGSPYSSLCCSRKKIVDDLVASEAKKKEAESAQSL